MIKETKTLVQLMRCFPGSFINADMEFIAVPETNLYFNLENCENKKDIQCKVLENFSRSAFKSAPYETEEENENYHDFVRGCINAYLETTFTEKNMEQIYIPLGNRANHELTIKFVESNYNLDILQEEQK